MKKNKIIIGVTQFGLPYGIMNTLKIDKKKELKKIIAYSKKKKINCLYTSKYYGSANKFLASEKIKFFDIIAKYKKNDLLKKNFDSDLNKFKKILQVDKISIMIDSFEKFNKDVSLKVYKKLINLKNKKIISKFGFSIYSFKNIDKICKAHKPDIIQCPYSIIDRRLEKKGLIEFFTKNKIEIHVRSIFLQGLLLSKPSELPKKFLRWKKIFKNYYELMKTQKYTNLEGCLNFVTKNKKINKVLVGIDNLNQLKEIISVKSHKKIKFPSIVVKNEQLINPSKW